MNDKRIEDFGTVSTLQDDDLFLVGGNGETFKTTFATIKNAVSSESDVIVLPSDVNFYDYDGTVVNSYTADEFAALTAMPANPTHAGLTSQGWNWSFEDAKAYVAKYGKLNVGQMYITDDGTTRIYIHLEKGRTSPMLGVCPNGTVDVDWGDGTEHDILTGTSVDEPKWTSNHIYTQPGNYVIRLIIEGEMQFIKGASMSGTDGMLRNSNNPSDLRTFAYQNAVRKIEMGNNITGSEAGTFNFHKSLSSIIFSNDIMNIGYYSFINSYSLSSITIPDGVKSIDDTAFYNCYALSIIIPKSITTIGTYAFGSCQISNIIIPDSITTIASGTFSNCENLSSIIISDNVISIGDQAFSVCRSLSSITIPKKVVSIGQGAFNACTGMAEYHLKPITPPMLGEEAFRNISSDCIIYVPYSSDHSILEAYKTATNWSAYASYMQEEPQ